MAGAANYGRALAGGQLNAAQGCAGPFCELTDTTRDYAIVLLDLQGNIASWHDGARAIMGQEAHEIMGAHFACFYPGEALEGGWPELELKVAAVEGRFGSECWRVRRDGSRFWAHVVLMALCDHDGTLRGFGNVIRELPRPGNTGDSQSVDRRMKDLITMLSHELRNPLAPIRSAVDLMHRKQLTQMELQWLRAVLDRQSARLVRLADDLLDVSRLSRGTLHLQREELDLAAVITAAVEMSRAGIDAHGQSLNVELPEAVRLTADPVRLGQVVMNLLDNAARYTPSGGRIWLTARSRGREVEIRVRDTGIGMAPEFVGKAFELFARGERPSERGEEGLGVGLTLSRHLVELHGGTLEAHSPGRGEGSEFLIRLPVSEPASQAHTVAADSSTGGAHAPPQLGGAAAPAAAQRDCHYVKLEHYKALNRLLSAFPSDMSTISG